MSRVTLVLKTNEGGLWALPQVRELVARGNDVTAVIPPGDGKLRRALDANQIRVVESPFDFSFHLSPHLLTGLCHLRRTLRGTRPDVLFYHLYASALACRFASLGMKVRRVHMVAGPLYLESRKISMIERYLCRLDDHLIAGSEYTAARYREIGMPDHRLSAIPYGVDVSRLIRGDNNRVNLFKVDPDTFVVVMVAYVYAPKSAVFPGVGIKGHDVLLNAWADFCAEHPHSMLVLVGSGFDEDGERHRQRLLRDHNVATNPNILWFESVDDVNPLYSSADLSVSPSLSENHGAALEASALSLPSIVSDAGALPETVTSSSGWVVKAGDRKALLCALGLAHRAFLAGRLAMMGDAARLYCERRFSHEDVVPQVADAVLGHDLGSGGILAFTEQRTWLLSDGTMNGLKSLGIVEALAAGCTVKIGARVGLAQGDGVAIAPGAVPMAIPWPASGFPRVATLFDSLATIWRIVGAADVIYADQPGVVGGLGLAIAKLRRKPIVVNVVGDANESVSPLVMPGVKGRLAHAIFPRLQRWSCAHATYANYVTGRVLQERYPARGAKESFSSSTAKALGPPRPRQFPTGPVSLVTVASLAQPYKGIDDLLDSVEICGANGLDVKLTVIGDGRLRHDLAHKAERVGLQVRFTGHLQGDDLYEELGRHDVFVLASWTEGLPRALVEAMADGLPAVATAVGGVPELLESHRIVPPHAPENLACSILELLGDENLWRATIRHNARVSQEFLAKSEFGVAAFVEAIGRLAGSAGSSS